MSLTKDDLIIGNVYSFNYNFLKIGWSKWKISRRWYHTTHNLQGYYVMTIQIPDLNEDFYVFAAKNNTNDYIIYYVRVNEMTEPYKSYDLEDDYLNIIKDGYMYDIISGWKIQLKDPIHVVNSELLAIKSYLKSYNCLDYQNPSEFPDNTTGINYYKCYTPKGIIMKNKLTTYYDYMNKIGYFIACSPPIYGKFSGGALYKRRLLEFNLLKSNF